MIVGRRDFVDQYFYSMLVVLKYEYYFCLNIKQVKYLS